MPLSAAPPSPRADAPHSLGPTTISADADPTYIDTAANDRAVRRWLYATMLAVLLALVVGGITRLTESGLSITVWKPVSGVIPPLFEAEWRGAYVRYLEIPEAQSVHAGITLDGFKRLYWWEWVHRLLARLAGLVIAVPYFVLLLQGRMRPALRLRLANLPLLVTLQGVLGWYMVQSGLTERTSVSPYRLVAHLALAVAIYVVATWTALRLRLRGETETHAVDDAPSPDRAALALAGLVIVVVLSGGFVAGTDAGLIFNTFPLMGGHVVPDGYLALRPTWRNWFEHPAAVQFNHRLLALLTLGISGWLAVRRAWPAQRVVEARAWRWVLLAVVVQVALGVATLLLRVPIPLAALHQLGAVALLTAALAAAAEGKGGGRT